MRVVTGLVTVLALMISWPACGDDDAAETVVGDTSAPETAPADAAEEDTLATDTPRDETSDPACDHQGFTAVAQDAGHAFGAFNYLAQDTLGEPVTTLNLQLVDGVTGVATEAGTYPITEDGYEACANCVLIYQSCDGNLSNCERTFLANVGTLTISTFGASGQQFTGTLSDVVLVEVTVASDFTSTLVAGGQTWCLDSYDFDATIQ